MSTNNLCFEQKYEEYQTFFSENFHFFVIKFSVYLNRHVFIMTCMPHAEHQEWMAVVPVCLAIYYPVTY